MPTLVHRIREMASADPGKPALFGPVRSEWRQLSLGSWWSSIRQAAGGLVALGVVPDEPVVLWGPAQPEWAVIWPAICAAGAIPVLLDPDAEDADLVGAIAEPEVYRVVTSGRERLERLLLLREHGSVGLERVITLDRPELAAPRLTDLEGLIGLGATRHDHVEQRMKDLLPTSVAAVLPSGARVTHERLFTDVAKLRVPERVLLACDPARRAALVAIAAVVDAGAEIWMGAFADDLMAALKAAEPQAALLEPDAWRLVCQAARERVDQSGGLRNTLIRLARRGSAPAVVRAAVEPILRELGIADCVAWCDRPLPAELSAALVEMGIEVKNPAQ